MKVCFFGMGSIGTRHVHNLRKSMEKKEKNVEIHAFRSSPGSGVPREYVDKNIFQWAFLEPPYDAVFITNPTSLHYETLSKAMDLASAFFIEKPVFHSSSLLLDELMPLKKKITYVACPLRFHPLLVHLKQDFSDKVLVAQVTSSSYLPDWRKGRDYRTSYSASREMGGGVALDLIHEVDYVRHLFGIPEKCQRAAAQFSSLEIKSDDYAAYLLTYRDKGVEIHLDYFGRTPQREIRLICEKGTYLGDLLKNTLTNLTTGEEIVFPYTDIYMEEMEYFLKMARGNTATFNDVFSAVETLRLAEGRNCHD